MSESLYIWSIYKRGTDPRFPSNHVAIEFEINGTLEAPVRSNMMVFYNIELAREHFRRRGLHCLPRDPNDDERLIESWI